MEAQVAPDGAPRIDQHFDCIRANLIRCDECNENFFFDFLRHPRYFVTHFKTCHLKNVLYRFNGCSEEENQRVRFGPRRKKDATAWFSQLKSTEKRMISMQDNKWGEIAERECWSCRLCKHGRKSSELPHAFEPNELGRRQALLHLRQFHEAAYNAFLSMLPAVGSSSSRRHASAVLPSHISALGGKEPSYAGATTSSLGLHAGAVGVQSAAQAEAGSNALSPASTQKQSIEAERSRLRRMRATPETKRAEAERSRRRREQLTPAQRQADTERRARKRQRDEERKRSCQRRSEASPEAKEREMKRSRDRRQNATEQQRQREAQRSRTRRQNATEEQRLRERERCRRRYEARKQQKQADEELFDPDAQPSTPRGFLSDATTPPSSATSEPMTPPPPRTRVLPADLEQRNQQLQQQQAGLGQQIQSLYASLSRPSSSSVEL